MIKKMALIKSVLILSLASVVLSCSPPKGWKSKSMMERIEESKLLVYGKVSSRTETPRTGGAATDVRYDIEVYCVLKKDGITQEIGASLSIEDLEPPACVSNKEVMTEDSMIIVMLRESDSKLMFDNINVQRAVFEGNNANLDQIAKNCEAKNIMLSGKQCPDVDRSKTCNSGAHLSYAVKLFVFCIFVALSANKMNL